MMTKTSARRHHRVQDRSHGRHDPLRFRRRELVPRGNRRAAASDSPL